MRTEKLSQSEAEEALRAAAERTLARFASMRPLAQSPERRASIARIAESYCAWLSRASGKTIKFASVKFYSYAEWASVRASVRDSVRASVLGIEGEIEILEAGGILGGVDGNGTCYIIMPTEDELNRLALEKVVLYSAKESAEG